MERLAKLKEMEARQPGDAFLKFAIAMEYIGMGRNADALAYLESLSQMHPQYVPTYYQLGRLLGQMGMTQRASQVYKEGIEVARLAGDMKTAGELQEALLLAEDE